MSREEVAAALAFFASSQDLELLRKTLLIIRPKAARAVNTYARTRRDVPQPADVQPTDRAATQDEALRTIRSVTDFGELQALSRVIGKRVEQLQSGESATTD